MSKMMLSNNSVRKKANAVFFSVLMVFSMVAVGFAAAPAAAVNEDTENRFENDAGETVVDTGQTVYQGEENLNFTNFSSGETYDSYRLEGTSGNREGIPLQMPIPEDQETGTYAESVDNTDSDFRYFPNESRERCLNAAKKSLSV